MWLGRGRDQRSLKPSPRKRSTPSSCLPQVAEKQGFMMCTWGHAWIRLPRGHTFGFRRQERGTQKRGTGARGWEWMCTGSQWAWKWGRGSRMHSILLCPENLSLWPGRAFSLVSASQKGQIAPCIWWSVEQIGILRHEVTSSVLVVQLLGVQHKGVPLMTDFCCFSFNCLASAGNTHSTSICLVLHIRAYDWGHFTFSWETGDTLFT